MLKEHSYLLRHVVALIDFTLLAGVFYLSHYLVSQNANLKPVTDYWFMFLGFLVYYGYFAWTRQLFSLLQFPLMPNLVWRTVLIFVSAGVIGAAILYLFPGLRDSRRLHFAFVLISCATVATTKELMRLALYWLRRHNRNTTPVLVLGRGRGLTRLSKQIRSNPHWGLRIVEQFDIDTPVEAFERRLVALHAEEVFFCVPRAASEAGFDLDPYLQVCEEVGRPARVFLNLHETVPEARWQYQPFMGRPTMVSHTTELDPDQLLIKRLVDVVFGLGACAFMFVILPVVALALRLESSRPIVIRRVRVGKGGKQFRMYAFRCEVQPSESGQGPLSAMGRVVRALGIERLPAFYNVLRGQMSLVGIRPAAPDELEHYLKWYHRRFAHKPGMTGLWRVIPSGNETLDELIRLDLLYGEQWSVLLDLRIAVRTWFGLGRRQDPWVAPRVSEESAA